MIPIQCTKLKQMFKLFLFQMQNNLTLVSGCPDDCLVALKILYNLLLSYHVGFDETKTVIKITTVFICL